MIGGGTLPVVLGTEKYAALAPASTGPLALCFLMSPFTTSIASTNSSRSSRCASERMIPRMLTGAFISSSEAITALPAELDFSVVAVEVAIGVAIAGVAIAILVAGAISRRGSGSGIGSVT